jgi:hypothetical protein
MPSAPYDPQDDSGLKSAGGGSETRAFIAKWVGSPALGTTTAVHAAVTDDGTTQTITTAITNPDVPRALTATTGGTSGDIKGSAAVTITGTDFNGNALTETLPVFTDDTGTTVTSLNAFKTVTSISQPAHDGTGATVEYGVADKLGVAHKMAVNTVLPGKTSLNGTLEGTDPTVTASATASKVLVDLNSALDGNEVIFYYLVDGDD